MVTDKKQIIEKVNAAFADNNMEGFLAFCADDVEWTMIGETRKKGKEAIREWMESMPAEAPKFDVKYVIAEDDFVVCCGDMTMKDEQKTEALYSFCDLYRFRDGKIAELQSWGIKTANTK